MLQLNRITKHRAGLPVVRDLSLHVARGESVAVTASNDAALTAVIQVASTLSPPDSGTVLLDGIDGVRDPFRARQRVAYAPGAEMTLRPGIRARDLWRFACAGRVRGKSHTFGMHLQQTGIDLDAPVDRLGAAQRRLLAVAIALDSDLPIVLLENPCDGLDAEWTRRIEDWIVDVRSGGAAVLLTAVGAPAAAPWITRVVRLDS